MGQTQLVRNFFSFCVLLLALQISHPSLGNFDHDNNSKVARNEISGTGVATASTTVIAEQEDHSENLAPAWTVIPFILLLTMIATGPLFYEHFWHKHYPKVAVGLAAIVVTYYLFNLHNSHAPIHSFFEYFQFIALLTGLFVASGGIMIHIDKKATPGANVALLGIGAVIANVIGTTGASMLLIRPFIRLNQHRIKSYHIILFIFIVSNIGGSLTPIGDPPLFLGFLKGVPFFWTLTHNLLPWAFAVTFLLVVFYFIDRRNKSDYRMDEEEQIIANIPGESIR